MIVDVHSIEDLEHINTTELVQHARWMGMDNASRAIPRHILIEAIWHNELPDAIDTLAEKRRKMSFWLKRFWGKKFQHQAPREECPECFKCRDMQIVDCFHKNKDQVT